MLKAFMGAGIKNKVVALFDNDTEGRENLKSLKNLSLPSNIKMFTYPDIKIAENYPTLGPTGKKRFNINGKAASIELYLGKSVLWTHKYPPIVWKGQVQKSRNYQGEIQKKRNLYDQFMAQVEDCTKNPQLLRKYDWSGVKLILNKIFDSFK